jgi:hypothetical protein
MDVCHLTRREARKFERCGRMPFHSIHRHVSFEEARAMVGKHEGHGDSTARWVGSAFRMIVDLPLKRPKAVGGVMQLVDGVVPGRRGKKFKCMRKGSGVAVYGIPACGAHERRLRVSEVNSAPRELEDLEKSSAAAVTSAGGCGASAVN